MTTAGVLESTGLNSLMATTTWNVVIVTASLHLSLISFLDLKMDRVHSKGQLPYKLASFIRFLWKVKVKYNDFFRLSYHFSVFTQSPPPCLRLCLSAVFFRLSFWSGLFHIQNYYRISTTSECNFMARSPVFHIMTSSALAHYCRYRRLNCAK